MARRESFQREKTCSAWFSSSKCLPVEGRGIDNPGRIEKIPRSIFLALPGSLRPGCCFKEAIPVH